jgi:DNA-binding MarR family transcriptional regulator
MLHLTDLEPTEAVAEARRQARDDREQAVERLDRYLRARLLAYLQNRDGERAQLAKALVAARTWAVREVETHRDRWSLLLEVLEDSRRVASTAEQVELLTDRESSILTKLAIGASESSGLRPKDLAARLGTSEQNVNNYLRRLETAGLVVRHRAPGQRAVLVFPTRKALDLADRFGSSASEQEGGAPLPGSEVTEKAPETTLWHLN